METVTTERMKHLVEKADEFAQLDAVTQRTFKLATEIIKAANEEAKEREEQKDEKAD